MTTFRPQHLKHEYSSSVWRLVLDTVIMQETPVFGFPSGWDKMLICVNVFNLKVMIRLVLQGNFISKSKTCIYPLTCSVVFSIQIVLVCEAES